MNLLEKLKGKLIVSCQALPGEALHSSFIMSKMAIAAMRGGASGIRAQGVDDINAIKEVCDLPMIGIIKKKYDDSDIVIGATSKEINALVKTKCEIIALDATNRKRPNNENIETLLKIIHDAKKLAMADISTYEEGKKAEQLGFDCISTTLSGYTEYSRQFKSVDLELIKELSKTVTIPVFAEGRIHSPDDLRSAYEAGAYSAVVGGAITRPTEITERYVEVLKER
ncbi:MAG: N-acetylmannosamine-6-phosphate 2-epimerase [Anaerorhabdus sp.]